MARVFNFVKIGLSENLNEDFVGINPALGLGAISDGSSSSMYSREWARLIVKSIIKSPHQAIELSNLDWLRNGAETWVRYVKYMTNTANLNLFQKRKILYGSSATMLAILLEANPGFNDGSLKWSAAAVGDSCVFIFRKGELLKSFPLTHSSQFGFAPPLLSLTPTRLMNDFSMPPIKPKHLSHEEGVVFPDDVILLATDALSEKLLEITEEKGKDGLADYLEMDNEAWRKAIIEWRAKKSITDDDTTLGMFSVPTLDALTAAGTSEPKPGFMFPESETADPPKPVKTKKLLDEAPPEKELDDKKAGPAKDERSTPPQPEGVSEKKKMGSLQVPETVSERQKPKGLFEFLSWMSSQRSAEKKYLKEHEQKKKDD